MKTTGSCLLIAAVLWLSTASIRGQTTTSNNGHGGLEAVLGVSNASVLLLDPSSETLYLGARGSVLALHSNNLTRKHLPIEWDAPERERKACLGKAKTMDDCHNYICLLEVLKDGSIYVCGSYAYDPKCAFIEPVTFALVKEDDRVKMESGKGMCPFDPRLHHTVVTADGVLYAASPTTFRGREFDISKTTPPEEEQVRMEQKWLNDPEFVSSALVRESPDKGDGDDDKIYFFFTETATEYRLFTKVRVTRVARVCKGDVGGSKTLQKRWTTFLKAQLVCKESRLGGQRYDILTHLYPLQHRPEDPASTHFYGLFTSQWGGERVSAVCVYSVADIATVMKTSGFEDTNRRCVDGRNAEAVPSPRPGQCIDNSLRAEGFNTSLRMPDTVLMFAKEHPLMARTVDTAPLLVRWGITYSKIAATNISGSDAVVLHLGTDQGELHSVSVVGRTATVLQETPLTTSVEPVNNILIHQGHALVGCPSSLSRVPVEGCSVYPSCEVCARAQGLGCVWDQNKCSVGPTGSPMQNETMDPLKVCGSRRCAPVVKELRAVEGLRVLLPCVSLSPEPCVWEHPGGRHTVQRHSHLEVTVSGASLGLYSCRCPAPGQGGPWGGQPCLTASYKLTQEGPTVGGRSDTGAGRPPVGGYLSCVLVGALVGAFVVVVVLRRRSRGVAQLDPLVDGYRRSATAANQGPAGYENELALSDAAQGQPKGGVL